MGRKKYTAEFKAKVALEAIREKKTINEIASQYGIHPQMVRAWKESPSKMLPGFLKTNKKPKDSKKELEKAYRKIGELELERDFLSDVLRMAKTRGEGVKWQRTRQRGTK